MIHHISCVSFERHRPKMRCHKKHDVSMAVKNLRKKLRLTQEQFAARVGVTWSTVNRWENGRGNPSPLACQQIADLISGMGAEGAGFLKLLFPEGI